MGGGVMEMYQGVSGEPTVVLRFMGFKIVQDNVEFPIGITGDNLVHEVEELPAAWAGIMAHPYHSGGYFQSSEQGCGAVSLILVAESSEGLTIRAGAASPGLAPEPEWRVFHPHP